MEFTKEQILSDITGVPHYTQNGEFVTKNGALRAMEFYADMKVKNLSSNNVVSGQRELLVAFGQFIDKDTGLLGEGYIESIADKFLSNQ